MNNVFLSLLLALNFWVFSSVLVFGQNNNHVEKNYVLFDPFQNFLQQRSVNISDLDAEAYQNALTHSEFILVPYVQASVFRSKLHISDDYYTSFDDVLMIISTYDVKNQKTKNIYLKEVFPGKKINSLYHADPETGAVYISISTEDGTEIVRFDTEYDYVVLGRVDFPVNCFYAMNKGKNFAFFDPSAVKDDRGSIVITDSEFNEIRRFEKLPDIAKKHPSIAFGNLKYANNKLYFNPILSDEIYEMDIEGNKKTIFAGLYEEDGGIKAKKEEELEKLTFFEEAPWAFQPYFGFEVTENYIYFTHPPGQESDYTIYNRATGKSIKYKRGFAKEPLGDKIHLIFDHICGVNGDNIYSINSRVHNNRNNKPMHHKKQTIPDYLDFVVGDETPFIHRYKFDFELLYSYGVYVMESNLEINKNH